MYKITFAEQQVVYQSKTDDPHSENTYKWAEKAVVQGEKKVVAGALRALADELDPPKSVTRGYGE